MKSSAKAIGTSAFEGHCGRPPAFHDCSLMKYDLRKNGTPVRIMMIVSGKRKNAWPTASMVLRSQRGSRLFTMSMRMCSLASKVQGEHRRNTALNSTHCSSSHEFDDVSKIFRTVAFAAETTTARRISQAM